MLYFDRIDISEEIDLAKSNSSKKCIFLTIFFFNHRFEFEDFICNGCHDLSTLSVNISDIAMITVKNIDYRYIIHNISKSEAIILSENSVLKDPRYK